MRIAARIFGIAVTTPLAGCSSPTMLADVARNTKYVKQVIAHIWTKP